MDYYTYQSTIVDSLQSLFYRIVGFLPNILAAIIVLLVGWMIAIFLAKVVQKFLVTIKIDSVANRLGLEHLARRAGRHLSVSGFGEWLVKWFILIAVFIAAADILGLTQVSLFLYGKVFPYFGNVIVAVAILMIGIIAANFLGDLVKGTMAAGELHGGDAMSAVTRWAIIIMAVLTALSQLNVATGFIEQLFTAVVAMFAIAGGIAFGLGGKDHAKKVLDNIERDFNTRR